MISIIWPFLVMVLFAVRFSAGFIWLSFLIFFCRFFWNFVPDSIIIVVISNWIDARTHTFTQKLSRLIQLCIFFCSSGCRYFCMDRCIELLFKLFIFLCFFSGVKRGVFSALITRLRSPNSNSNTHRLFTISNKMKTHCRSESFDD